MVKLFKERQALKASFPMTVTEFGMVKSAKDTQSRKGSSPNVCH